MSIAERCVLMHVNGLSCPNTILIRERERGREREREREREFAASLPRGLGAQAYAQQSKEPYMQRQTRPICREEAYLPPAPGKDVPGSKVDARIGDK